MTLRHYTTNEPHLTSPLASRLSAIARDAAYMLADDVARIGGPGMIPSRVRPVRIDRLQRFNLLADRLSTEERNT